MCLWSKENEKIARHATGRNARLSLGFAKICGYLHFRIINESVRGTTLSDIWWPSYVTYFPKCFRLTVPDWSARDVTYVTSWLNDQFYLNNSLITGCLKDNMKQHSSKSICVSTKWRPSAHKFSTTPSHHWFMVRAIDPRWWWQLRVYRCSSNRKPPGSDGYGFFYE